MAHIPHFTFLSLNLSCMCGLHVYNIKFGFSLLFFLFCNNLIMRPAKRTFGWQSVILPNSTTLGIWFNQKFLMIMDTRKWIVGKEDSFRLNQHLCMHSWNWQINECSGRYWNSQGKGKKQKKFWIGRRSKAAAQRNRSTQKEGYFFSKPGGKKEIWKHKCRNRHSKDIVLAGSSRWRNVGVLTQWPQSAQQNGRQGCVLRMSYLRLIGRDRIGVATQVMH